ncbi:MAG: DUF3048 domain-containing protein [Microthrixaceae bacterium]|jgi:hypothetical protein|nr:DUF3048 domain-containing protein [Microthrixaceae bacterium]
MTEPSTSRIDPRIIGGVIAAVVVLIGAVAFALRGGDDAEPAASTTTAATTTTTKVATTTEPASGPVAPLTGLKVADPALVNRPALVAKIDNLDRGPESALPQAGVSRADVVFEEIVEGNITRFAAVFHSKAPGRIGPIRSARTTDVILLPQLGPVLFAWSGGNDGVVGEVRRSPFLLDVGHDAASSSYSREPGRRAPHNLFVEADELWGRRPEATAPPNPIFQFRADDQPPSPLAEPAQGVQLGWGGGSNSSPVSWHWDPGTRLYLRSQNDREHNAADGTRVSAANIVVMVTEYGRSAADTRSPEAHTVGEGELFVYTDGKVVWGRWTRLAQDQPATLTDRSGNPILLTPGNTWVELPRSGGVTTIN